jgi:cation diffusion facilitator family transporter
MDSNNDKYLRYRETRKVTLIGSAIDLVLGVAKIIVGYAGSSQALVADGIHSLSDLATDFMVLYAARHASRDADEEHPYGHGRFETLMTVALGMALIGVASGIAWDAIRRMFDTQSLLHPTWITLVVATLSILSKEWIYRYTMRVAERLNSNLLKANAWHSRSDAISSVIVVVGIIGTMAGVKWLDAVAAIGVGLMIAKIGWDLAWSSLKELVDTGLEAERVEAIRGKIVAIPGVRDCHMLRTRRMGSDALVDVHIQVDNPRISVSEGHQLSEAVRQRLIEEIEEVSDVLVHIDPENDMTVAPCCELPLRVNVLEELGKVWEGVAAASRIKDIRLHYLGGEIHVEILLPLSLIHDIKESAEIRQALEERGQSLEYIGQVSVCFC